MDKQGVRKVVKKLMDAPPLSNEAINGAINRGVKSVEEYMHNPDAVFPHVTIEHEQPMSEDRPIYEIRSPFRDPEGRNHEFAYKATVNGYASMCSCGWQCAGYFGSEEEAAEAWKRDHVMSGAHVAYSPGPVLPNHVLLNLKKGDELPDGAYHWNGIRECWERVWNYSKAKEGIAYSCPHFRLTPEQQRDIVKAQSYLTLEAAGVSKEHADKILGNGRPDPNSPLLSDTITEEDWTADVYQEAIRNPKPRPLIDDLLDYCAKWQRRLRLMDWKVYVKIAPQ